MTAKVLEGRTFAAELRSKVRRQAADFLRRYGYSPQIAAVMVGSELASSVYVQQILRACANVGVPAAGRELPERPPPTSSAAIETLNVDPLVAGIIVQQPLPRHIPLSTLTDTIVPAKDIDGIHPLNTGLMALGYEGFLPACAEAAVEIPKFYGYPLEGKRAVVIGRSNVVGKPVQLLLMREHCTVTVCHRRTRDLAAEIARAEIVVSAAGAAGLVTGNMLHPGALVVDIGINVVRGKDRGRRRVRVGAEGRGGDHAGAGRRWPGDECRLARAPDPRRALAADWPPDHRWPWAKAPRRLSARRT